MKRSIALVAALALGPFVGCGYNPRPRAEPVAVNGTLLFADKKPVGSVTVNFIPAGVDATASSGRTGADGKFTATLVPGTYMIGIEAGPGATAFRSVPTKYHSPDPSFKVNVVAGQPLDITLTP